LIFEELLFLLLLCFSTEVDSECVWLEVSGVTAVVVDSGVTVVVDSGLPAAVDSGVTVVDSGSTAVVLFIFLLSLFPNKSDTNLLVDVAPPFFLKSLFFFLVFLKCLSFYILPLLFFILLN
jgi:hypothetical protein